MLKVLKLFGVLKNEVETKLSVVKDLEDLEMNIFESEIDLQLIFNVNENNRLVFAKVFQILSDHVFTDEDESLFERLDALLQIRNRTVSVCEYGTGGKFVSGVCEFENSTHYLDQGIVLTSTAAFASNFGIDPSVIFGKGVFSNEIAGEISLSFAQSSSSDFSVLVLLNLNLSPKTILEIEPFGLTFVAISGPNGVNVYKHLFVGDKEKVIKLATAATCFHLIKELYVN